MRSLVRKKLDVTFDLEQDDSTHRRDTLVAILIDCSINRKPLDLLRLHGWHNALFVGAYDVLNPINIASFRTVDEMFAIKFILKNKLLDSKKETFIIIISNLILGNLMKSVLILVLLFTSLFARSSVKDVTIGKFDFVILTNSYDVYDSKGEWMKLYREERNKNLVFQLRLTLKDVTGNCSSKGLQDGAYEIDDKGITLYSFWDRGGKAYLEPYGARIQRYEIQEDASLKLVASMVYIEATRKNKDEDSGMLYLFKEAKNEAQKEKLKDYVKEIERVYKAKFVYEEDAKKLIKQVKEALKKRLKSIWQKR